MDKLRCNAKVQVGALMGTTYIKVYYPAAAARRPRPPGSRATRSRCVRQVSFNGPINLVPMPNRGWIRTQTTMAVEQDATPLPTGADARTLPGHAARRPDWNWCTAP